jgi:hypothetical protein
LCLQIRGAAPANNDGIAAIIGAEGEIEPVTNADISDMNLPKNQKP